MKRRLFWKILLGFWLTWLLTTGVTLATLFLVLPTQSRVLLDPKQAITQAQHQRERELTLVLQSGGEPAMRRLAAVLPPVGTMKAEVHIVDTGQGPRVLYLLHGSPPVFPLPWPWLFQLVASLIFSAALAAYMTRPIDRLRGGFRQLAQGALSTRLAPGMGRRRDEIADLAKDFDAMAERLEQLVANRDRLLHDVSHELRSPLARMSVAMGLARQNPERVPEALERIEADGARLNAIVGDLLSLSRAEVRPPGEEIYFDVAAMLELICADARFEAEPRQVGVKLEIDATLSDPARAPAVAGPPELIRRALENVIRNAMRFSPAGGSVRVDARLSGGSIVIEVRDRGPGVDAALRKSMFEPFVKGEEPASGAGTGLGLAIARRALAAHGGTVDAFSPEDGGLLVRIVLPLTAALPT